MGKGKRRRKKKQARQSALLRRKAGLAADAEVAATQEDVTGSLPRVQAEHGKEGDNSMPPRARLAEWIRNNANSVIAIFTVVIAIATVLQIFIYRSQLDEMRIDQRAWLGIKFVPVQPTLNGYFTWPLIINNTGKTPAKTIHGLIAIRYLPVDTPIDFRTPAEMRAAGVKQDESMPLWMGYATGVLFPNDPTTVDQFTLAQGAVSNPQKVVWDSTLQNRYAKGEIYIEIHGTFDYDDAAGNGHWTKVCDIITAAGEVVPLETSKACIAYNSMDSNK